jgi:hypothetical protein
MEIFTVFLIGATTALGCMAFGLGAFVVGSTRKQAWRRPRAFASALQPHQNRQTRRLP